MKVFCDLHLHSCLSPCADDEMTPWNMVGMAKVRGQHVIAITDHNTALNAPEAMRAGDEYGVGVIAGMEITSKEEAHILGYFPTLDDALAASAEIDAHLPPIMNDPSLFGNQTIIGADDEPVGSVDKLLINAVDLSVSEVCELIARHNGVPVPAHINRGSNGMIGALGIMPFLPEHPIAEVYSGVPCPEYAVKGRFLLHSSDAHRLEDMQEAVFSLDADEDTASAVIERLKTEYASRGKLNV